MHPTSANSGVEIQHPWTASIVPRTLLRHSELHGTESAQERAWKNVEERIKEQMRHSGDIEMRVALSILFSDENSCINAGVRDKLSGIYLQALQNSQTASMNLSGGQIEPLLLSPFEESHPLAVSSFMEPPRGEKDEIQLAADQLRRALLFKDYGQWTIAQEDLPQPMVHIHIRSQGRTTAEEGLEDVPPKKKRRLLSHKQIGRKTLSALEELCDDIRQCEKGSTSSSKKLPFSVPLLQERRMETMRQAAALANASLIRGETVIVEPQWQREVERSRSPSTSSSDVVEDAKTEKWCTPASETSTVEEKEMKGTVVTNGALIIKNGKLKIQSFDFKRKRTKNTSSSDGKKLDKVSSATVQQEPNAEIFSSLTKSFSEEEEEKLSPSSRRGPMSRNASVSAASSPVTSPTSTVRPVKSLEGVSKKTPEEMRELLEQWGLSPTLKQAFLIALEKNL